MNLSVESPIVREKEAGGQPYQCGALHKSLFARPCILWGELHSLSDSDSAKIHRVPRDFEPVARRAAVVFAVKFDGGPISRTGITAVTAPASITGMTGFQESIRTTEFFAAADILALTFMPFL